MRRLIGIPHGDELVEMAPWRFAAVRPSGGRANDLLVFHAASCSQTGSYGMLLSREYHGTLQGDSGAKPDMGEDRSLTDLPSRDGLDGCLNYLRTIISLLERPSQVLSRP